MGIKTNISWADASWNPWQGCAMVSAGCDHCYMFSDKIRYGQDPEIVVRSKPPTFNLPLKLKEPQRVFTCSWSDFFIKDADPWRGEAWDIIKKTPHLTYLILTKRIERVEDRLPWGNDEPWPNVWLMVSVEDQETTDRRIPQLLRINAAVRGVSYEPALGSVNFEKYLREIEHQRTPSLCAADFGIMAPTMMTVKVRKALHWIIVGGESGPASRPFNVMWAIDTIRQCKESKTAVFVKQIGSRAVAPVSDGTDKTKLFPIITDDPKGSVMAEWPYYLRIQEWPQ